MSSNAGAPSSAEVSPPVRVNLAYIVLIAIAAALGGLMFGFDVAIITGAGPFIEAQFHLDALRLGWAFLSLFFAACIGPVFWTLLPEIFPNGVRGKAMTVPVLTQWVANAVVVLLFPAVFHAIGQAATFGLLACACLAQALFTLAAVPETRNRSLEDIAQHWRKP